MWARMKVYRSVTSARNSALNLEVGPKILRNYRKSDWGFLANSEGRNEKDVCHIQIRRADIQRWPEQTLGVNIRWLITAKLIS